MSIKALDTPEPGLAGSLPDNSLLWGIGGIPGLYPLGAGGTPAQVVTTRKGPETHWFK